MAVLRNTIPLRVKLIALLTLALVASSGTILGIGVSIFTDDKGSYILDFNYNQVRAAANAVESQVEKAVLMMRLSHALHMRREDAQIKPLYEEANRSIKLKRYLVSDVDSDGQFNAALTLGDDGTLVHAFEQQGWDRFKLAADPVLVGRSPTGELAVAILGKTPARGGEPEKTTAYLGLLEPDLNLEEATGDFEIFLIDSFGEPLFSKTRGFDSKEKTPLAKMLKSVADDTLASGVRKWGSGVQDYLVGYHRLGFKELTVVGLISEKAAFAAISGIFFRSATLGFGILLIVIGFVLAFVQRMTDGLRQMAAVTEKVAQGSFAFRVDNSSMGNDEIGALATSFNSMADKIDQLMSEVEARVESKHDKEAVSAVQGYLFPEKPFEHANLNVWGSSLPAQQCGGDWWHYEKVGDYVIVMVGHVEGKGLSAAMAMSAVRGAVATFMATTTMLPKGPPFFKLLINHLNAAVYASSRGKVKMSCFFTMIDTWSGKLQAVNCGHVPPYLHRLEFGGRPDNDADRFSTFPKLRFPPLGESAEISVDAETVQLKPGDVIFWYTPALYRTRNAQGENIKTAQAFNIYARACDEFETAAARISAGVLAKAGEFLGEVATDPPDDITAVVAGIPKKAYFMERDGEKAAA